MLPRTARFDQVITESHQMVASADILSNGVVVASGLPIKSGTVTADRNSFSRRTLTCEIVGTQWVPKTATDPLTIYGNEIRIWRGVQYPDGGTELVPAGVYGIRSVDVLDPSGVTTVTGIDRCKTIAEARFVTPYTVLAGASSIGTIGQLLKVVPQAALVVDPTLADLPMQQVVYDRDRAMAVVDIATALGGEVFSDAWGNFVLQPVPDASNLPVATLAAGPGGVVVSSKRTSTRDAGYNAVIANSATTTTTATAVVVDDDPTSPTYFYGPYGQVPVFYTSSLLTSNDQCAIAANGILQDLLGVAKSVNLTAVPNPALEPGDVIRCVFTDGTAEQHVIDQLSFGLTAADPMTANTRQVVTRHRGVTRLSASRLTGLA
jgi:hypothetical protein